MCLLFIYISVVLFYDLDTPTLPNGQTMPLVNEDDLRQVTILSKPDWERIQYQLNRRAIEEEKRRQIKEEKEKMAATSKEMVKNWSNTIAVRIYHFFSSGFLLYVGVLRLFKFNI